MGSLPWFWACPTASPILPKPVLPGPRNKPLIGIAWSGGTVRTNFSDRTLKLSDLKRICACRISTSSPSSMAATKCTEEADQVGLFCGARDFDSLQTQIGMCDLVITVCQTALHQAGAMGVPCWVLTPRKAPGCAAPIRCPGTTASRSCARKIDGEWSSVIDRVATELKKRRASAAA
jgi:hypothetical protein